MLGFGDVACVGIPATRYIRKTFPNANVHFLTYSVGADLICLAEPEVNVIALEKELWPDNIIPAMEQFLILAEKIIALEFDTIINLDTWFMPCFLARFLKDAGEPVQGNFMSIPVDELIEKLHMQTLSQAYVHEPANYMNSTFFSMSRWHTPWWEVGAVPEFGYPEFYLRHCCGFSDIEIDMSINIDKHQKLQKEAKGKKIIALATEARTGERNYPHGNQLRELLESAGYHVWSRFDGSQPLRKTLSMLKTSDLLVTVPSAPQWLATTVNCPSLVLVGDVDPRTLMPDYATEHGVIATPEELLESVKSIFE